MSLILSTAIFIFGNISGFFLRGVMEKKAFHMNEQASKNFLIIIIAVTWVIAMIVDVADPTYDVPLAVHGILGVIVGFFFAKPTQTGGEK